MENMEIKFGVIELMGPLCSMDHNDRLYLATCGDHEFEVLAQYWSAETGKFTGTITGARAETRGWTLLRGGLKNPDAHYQWFTESPAWDAFEAATGVTPKAFLEAFEEFIEDEAAREAAKADED